MLAAIETTGDTCGVALFDGNTLLGELHLAIRRSHDRLLAHLFKELLAATGVAPSDLKQIAVSAGPGSFTGIRIGISFATGLAMASGAGLIAVPTLEAIAYGVRHLARISNRSRVISLVPAGQGKLYAGVYQINPEFHSLTPPREIAVRHIASLLDENVFAAGPGALLLDRACSDSIAVDSEHLSAEGVGRMGLYLHYRGVTTPPEEITPLYIGNFVPVLRATTSPAPAITTSDD